MNSNFSFEDEDYNCNQVDLATQNDLSLRPTNMDITNALNRIGPDKAPSPDGLNAHFSKNNGIMLAQPRSLLLNKISTLIL